MTSAKEDAPVWRDGGAEQSDIMKVGTLKDKFSTRLARDPSTLKTSPSAAIEAIELPPDVANIAARINAARAIERAIEAGDLLLRVKAALPHGAWLPWLSEYCPGISPRTAQGYMRVARDLPPEMRNAAHLTLAGALRLLSSPGPDDKPTPDPIETWLESRQFWDVDMRPAAYLLDAADWTPDRIAEALTRRVWDYATPPTAEEVSAWLDFCPPDRSECCSRGNGYSPEGYAAERLYRESLAYQIRYHQQHLSEQAAFLARRIGQTEIAARLDGSARAYAPKKKPQAAATVLDQAARTAAFVDWFHTATGTEPDDGWALPIGMWSVICLHAATDEAGWLWEMARGLMDIKVTRGDVEALLLFKAAEVFITVNTGVDALQGVTR